MGLYPLEKKKLKKIKAPHPYTQKNQDRKLKMHTLYFLILESLVSRHIEALCGIMTCASDRYFVKGQHASHCYHISD